MSNSWPTSTDYNEAVQVPTVNFSDPELRSAQVRTNNMGLPLPCAGNFADVYQFQSSTGRSWAVKCFTRQVPRQNERYAAISDHLRQAQVSFTVAFEYLEQGIRVSGKWYPILKMDWVEGQTLNQFIRGILHKPRVLQNVLQVWLKAEPRLREAQLAHGDLQHGNVMLVPGPREGTVALRLIDYDGLWVPALTGRPSGEVGHANYQHPQRAMQGIYSADVDRFPHFVIATALYCLSQPWGAQLWETYDNGENLLFTKPDFEAPEQSELLRQLWKSPDPTTRAWAGRLIMAAQSPLSTTPYLSDLLNNGRMPTLTAVEEQKTEALLNSTRNRSPVTASWSESGNIDEPDQSTQSAAPLPWWPRLPQTQHWGTFPKLDIQSLRPWLPLIATAVAACVFLGFFIAWAIRSGPTSEKQVVAATTPEATEAAPVRSPSTPPTSLPVFDFSQSTRSIAEAEAAQQATEDFLGVKKVKTNDIGMELVLLPPGKFLMGEADQQVEVSLTKAFYVGKTEVTQGQWSAVMSTKPWKGQGFVKEGASYPATYVSWEDAVEFCQKLTERERAADGLDVGWEYRLPSEAEWEYACRAGTQTEYYFGDEEDSLGDYAWFGTNAGDVGERYAHEVSTKKANPFGLHDLHGNVWEWCQDGYGSKLPGGVNPLVTMEGSGRVFRGGGCWFNSARVCRSACRSRLAPSLRSHNLGFRLALSPSGSDQVPPPTPRVAPVPPPSTSPAELRVFDSSKGARTTEDAGAAQQAAADFLGVEKVKKNDIGMELVLLPPGKFLMGETGEQVEVTLTEAFYVGKTEVTQGQWEAVMKTTPWKNQSLMKEGATYPATLMSWEEAMEFCQKRTEREQSAGRLPLGWEYRLPNEAEWEYACRAGTQAIYNYGDDASQLGDYAWYAENAYLVNEKYPHGVGMKKGNAWGLLDMHGNVCEWCLDGNEKLSGGRDSEKTVSFRIARGGCWFNSAQHCRSALRSWRIAPSHRLINVGFRLVLSPADQ